jgi:hypothetical protein
LSLIKGPPAAAAAAAAHLVAVLAPVLAELTGFLRKANRQLRQAALAALEVRAAASGSA